MTNKITRRSYTSTLPIMVGMIALNSYPLLSSDTIDSTGELYTNPSRISLNKMVVDEDTFARINEYVSDTYNVKGDENRQMNLTSDLFYFNFVQNFIDDQVDLDADFMEALNNVTMKVGKTEPTKLRF